MIQNPNMSISKYDAAKRRLCPKCNELLKAVTVGNIVQTKADQRGRFPTNAAYQYGSVKSYNTEYQCTNCRMRYKAEDLKKIDQSYKKTK